MVVGGVEVRMLTGDRRLGLLDAVQDRSTVKGSADEFVVGL